jgi:hypothetical protein
MYHRAQIGGLTYVLSSNLNNTMLASKPHFILLFIVLFLIL